MTQRGRRVHQALFAIPIALTLSVSPARAGWEQGIVQVHATTARILGVAGFPDGSGGAQVVWQEETSADIGSLHLTRLLPDGTLDPDASDLTLVPTESSRGRLTAIPDGRGGGYLWWLEGAAIFLTHVEANGLVTGGWPEGGRRMGTLVATTALPQAFPDGGGGLYIGWQGSAGELSSMQRTLVHVGPDGQRTGRWKTTAMTLADPILPAGIPYGVSFAPAADGGVWVGWARLLLWEPDSDVLRGEYRVTHILATGQGDRIFNLAGRPVGEWSADIRSERDVFGWRLRPIAVADAGDNGCYVLRHDFSAGSSVWVTGPRVFRYASNGRLRLDWSVEGRAVSGVYYSGGPTEDSPQLVAGTDGSVTSGAPFYGVESSHGITVEATIGSGGAVRRQVFWGESPIVEIRSDGAALMSLVVPRGWRNGMTGGLARLRGALVASDGRRAEFAEVQPDYFSGVWYGAAAIASLGPESALLMWSQVQGRHGLFANRLVLGQPVLDVGPSATAPPTRVLRAAFARGEGVQLRATFGSPGDSRIQLFDLAGRQVAGASVGEGRALDLVVPDSADLASGLYFARVTHGAESQVARVVVAR